MAFCDCLQKVCFCYLSPGQCFDALQVDRSRHDSTAAPLGHSDRVHLQFTCKNGALFTFRVEPWAKFHAQNMLVWLIPVKTFVQSISYTPCPQRSKMRW